MQRHDFFINHYGLHVFTNAVSQETCELISKTIKQTANIHKYFSDTEYKGDELVEKSFSMYGVNCVEALSEILLPKVEKIAGKTLVPTYTYTRIYYNGASMAEHLDRPSCEYSVTLTLSTDKKPWPIWMRDLTGDERELFLYTGDMCLYKGQKVPHWRNKYEGEEQIQAFIHYVDANGPNSQFKYDGRPMMGMHPSTRNKR